MLNFSKVYPLLAGTALLLLCIACGDTNDAGPSNNAGRNSDSNNNNTSSNNDNGENNTSENNAGSSNNNNNNNNNNTSENNAMEGPVGDGLYRISSLALTRPETPAPVLNSLVTPNVNDGTLIILIEVFDFEANMTPTRFKIHGDAGLEGDEGAFTFDPEAGGTETWASVDASGRFEVETPADRMDFPVTSGLGEDAAVEFLLPIRQFEFAGTLDGDTIKDGTLTGIIINEDTEGLELPVGPSTLELNTVLGAMDVDLDEDGQLDGWTIAGDFTAERVEDGR